jgi:hypothetical protein
MGGKQSPAAGFVISSVTHCSTTEFTIYIFSEIVQDDITKQKLCKSKVFISDT